MYPLVSHNLTMKQGPFNNDGPLLERQGQPSVERRGKVSKQNRYEPVPCGDAIADRWFLLTVFYFFLMIYTVNLNVKHCKTI